MGQRDVAAALHLEGVPEYAILRCAPKIAPLGECFVWTASTTQNGYPQIHVGGKGGKTMNVHRYLWAVSGNLRPDCALSNRCGNKRCVRPSHWFQVTRLEVAWKGAAHASHEGKIPPGHRARIDCYRTEEFRARQRFARSLARELGLHPDTILRHLGRKIGGDDGA